MSEEVEAAVAKASATTEENEVTTETQTPLKIESNKELETTAVSHIDSNELGTAPSVAMEKIPAGEDTSSKAVAAAHVTTAQNVESIAPKSNEAEHELPKGSALEVVTATGAAAAEDTSNEVEHVTYTKADSRSPKAATVEATASTGVESDDEGTSGVGGKLLTTTDNASEHISNVVVVGVTQEARSSIVATAQATALTNVKSDEQKSSEMVEKIPKDSAALQDASKVVDDKYAAHVTYMEDGSAIFTDPETNYNYKWSEKENSWVPCDSSANLSSTSAASSTTADNPYENEHYKWCNDTQKWLPKVQTTETEHYKWDAEKHEWLAKTPAASTHEGKTEIAYDIDEQGQRCYTDTDGAAYFWDAQKNAWFPKIDDDFMARYQMNYGFIDNTSAGEEEKRQRVLKEAKRKEEELKCMAEEARAAADTGAAAAGGKRKATSEPPKWFDLDPERNTKVYVSNLPLDITIDEFTELMGKCGMIMRDPQTQKYKLKLYTEADGQIKGDGLCDYIKVESVGLAMSILDEYNLRGNKIRVQPAKFQMRGEYNPALKPKRKKKDKEKLQKMKEKLFDWRPEKMRGERTKNEKVVILKNLFEPETFEKEVQLILEYQNDLREECSKCGTVRKVVIYDRHAEGVAQVNMSTPEEADSVIQMMQGRFFGKRQLTAEHWDGNTKYKIAESEKEVQERLSNWDQFLETDDEKNKQQEQAQEQAQAKNAAQNVETKVES